VNKFNLSVLLTTCLLATGCATMTGWTPTVDTYNDPNAYRLNQDMQDCQQLAKQAAGTLTETATGTAAGALLGAAGGAAIGAVTGNAGAGAAIGAAAGGIGGGGYSGVRSDDTYKNAFRSCLRQRGHTVLN